jgi:hypothetical protein
MIHGVPRNMVHHAASATTDHRRLEFISHRITP